jgi:TolB-like protein
MICGSGAEPSGRMRDEKLHAVVARSTFPSQNAQNTSCSDHFSNGFGALLEVEMSKKGMPVVARSTFGS